MSNRLKLDFQMDTAAERREFLNRYVEKDDFLKKPLTEDELETCANYLLWGKDEDGKNCVQRKEIEIKTKYGTWDKKEDESLDALVEEPAFNEATLIRPGEVPKKIPRETFSRSKALKEAPDLLKPIFIELFDNIDRIDLLINYYDLDHGKRKNPPREELLNKFTIKEQEEIKEESTHLNQYRYLKLRHYLVELRRQQFTLKDTYSNMIQRHTLPTITLLDSIEFGEDIQILPLGANNNKILSKLIFREEIIPSEYDEKDLKLISNFLWEEKEEKDFYFDFENLEHVYNLFNFYFELEDNAIIDELESETKALLKTLEYYIKKAKLNEAQEEILQMKIAKKKNQDIANYINKKYNKSYTANYISTIFRQKIIKQINEAAAFHKEIINNIFFEENFKKCSCCGKILLRSTENFVKKSRAKDGFAGRCKRCDKIARG